VCDLIPEAWTLLLKEPDWDDFGTMAALPKNHTSMLRLDDKFSRLSLMEEFSGRDDITLLRENGAARPACAPAACTGEGGPSRTCAA
jgi:hypothetical protein